MSSSELSLAPSCLLINLSAPKHCILLTTIAGATGLCVPPGYLDDYSQPLKSAVSSTEQEPLHVPGVPLHFISSF